MEGRMDIFTVIRKRRSVRSFADKPVEAEKLGQILEAVNLAPSAGNLQAYEVVLVRDIKKRRKLANASYGQRFVHEAPLSLVFLASPARSAGEYGKRGEKLYCIQDATIAVSFAVLAITALGLASCWVGAFDDQGVLEAVEAENSGLVPVAVLPVGYATEDPLPAGRRSLKDLVHTETVRG
jgi:nitroreductase